MPEFLTTKELAELLRIKERKVYDLAASGELPCSRAMGKLLFPREAVSAWVASHSSGYEPRAAEAERPAVILGSHDPLLEWALREARTGLAVFLDGSLDGLERFAHGEGIATGIHLFDPEADDWNRVQAAARFDGQPVVLVEWARRARGLITVPGNPKKIASLEDLRGCKVAARQPEAGAQLLFDYHIGQAGLKADDMELLAPVRSESDAALAVLEGKADSAFGLSCLATQYGLEFVPLLEERYDLLVARRDWFEPPFQTLLDFCRTPALREKAAALGGYDVSHFGRVRFNG